MNNRSLQQQKIIFINDIKKLKKWKIKIEKKIQPFFMFGGVPNFFMTNFNKKRVKNQSLQHKFFFYKLY